MPRRRTRAHNTDTVKPESRSGPVTVTYKPTFADLNPNIAASALMFAGGDQRRVIVVSPTQAQVVLQPRKRRRRTT